MCLQEESAGEVLPLTVKRNRRWETSSVASMTSDEGNSTPKRKPGRKSSVEDPLKRRLWTIFKTVFDFQVRNHAVCRNPLPPLTVMPPTLTLNPSVAHLHFGHSPHSYSTILSTTAAKMNSVSYQNMLSGLFFMQLDGRHLIDVFRNLPMRKDYPDYYQVISEPIDMSMIESNIKNDKVNMIFITCLHLLLTGTVDCPCSHIKHL